MLLSRCALFWRDFLLGAGRCFVIPIPQLCLLWRVSAVPDKSWAALFLHFPFQREKTEYFSVCWVCYLHLLLTNGALAAVCHFAVINPSWLILNSGLESSGVLTLHLFLLLSIAVSFFFMSHMRHTSEPNGSVETRAHLQLFNSIFNLCACVLTVCILPTPKFHFLDCFWGSCYCP